MSVPRAVIHGDVLRALMAKHGMSSAGLAMRASVSPALIRMFTNGYRTSTKTLTADRIADALGEPMSTFATALPRAGGTQTRESA